MAYQTNAAWRIFHGSAGESKVLADRDSLSAIVHLDRPIKMKMKPEAINKACDDLIEAINDARAWLLEPLAPVPGGGSDDQ